MFLFFIWCAFGNELCKVIQFRRKITLWLEVGLLGYYIRLVTIYSESIPNWNHCRKQRDNRWHMQCLLSLRTELRLWYSHYNDVILGAIASQITSIMTDYSTVYSGADQIKHQSSASLAFVRGIHRWPVNSPHKWPVTRKMFPFDDIIVVTGDSRWSRSPFLSSLAVICIALFVSFELL